MFIKICGITSEADALVAVGLGADALGFVFAPSKRQLSPQTARDIARRVPREALTVGVFRNEPREKVVKVVAEVGLGAAQLHGVETPQDCRWIAERVPTIIKAFSAESAAIETAREFGAKYVLLDAMSPGSGSVFDWSLAENAPRGLKLIMAGGLNPENVPEAIVKVRPWGVDVSSGVESAPGKKDPTLIRRFIDAATAAAAQVEQQPDQPEDESRLYDWELE